MGLTHIRFAIRLIGVKSFRHIPQAARFVLGLDNLIWSSRSEQRFSVEDKKYQGIKHQRNTEETKSNRICESKICLLFGESSHTDLSFDCCFSPNPAHNRCGSMNWRKCILTAKRDSIIRSDRFHWEASVRWRRSEDAGRIPLRCWNLVYSVTELE
jgi:hypothetical protein